MTVNKSDSLFDRIFPQEEWWKNDKEDLMQYVYWCKRQMPPSDPILYEENWQSLKKQLTEKHGDGENK